MQLTHCQLPPISMGYFYCQPIWTFLWFEIGQDIFVFVLFFVCLLFFNFLIFYWIYAEMLKLLKMGCLP